MKSIYPLVLIVVLKIGLSHQEIASCSIVQTKRLQEQFQECSQKHTDKFHYNPGDGHVCELMSEIVNTCVPVFRTCNSAREVKRMQNRHTEALINQYRDFGDLESCSLVKAFRETGGETKEVVKCDNAKTAANQDKMRDCSHKTSSSTYMEIMDLENTGIISEKLCNALKAIGTICVKHMSECYNEEDFSNTKRGHIEQMKAFLLDMSASKVNKDALDNCKILEYTENFDDVVEDVHSVSDVTEKINDEVETETEATTVTQEPPTTTTTTTTTTTITATETTSFFPLPGKDSRSVDANEDNPFDVENVYDTDHDKVYQILNIDKPDDAPSDNANDVNKRDKDINDATASTEAAERLHSDPLSSSSPKIFIHSVISSAIPLVLIFVTAFL